MTVSNRLSDNIRSYLMQQENAMNILTRVTMILSVVAITLVTSSVASATLLQIEIDQSVGGAPAMGGSWTQISASGTSIGTSISGGFYDGVDITVDGTHTRSNPTSGYNVVEHTDGLLDNLLSGGQLTNSSSTNVVLLLEGLPDGDYEITTYHHTPLAVTNEGIFDLELTDSLVTSSVIHDDEAISFGASVTTATLSSFVTPFTINNDDPATITLVPGTGIGADDHLNLNGFELSFVPPAGVPEPSSFLLLALGAMGLTRYTRRRAC